MTADHHDRHVDAARADGQRRLGGLGEQPQREQQVAGIATLSSCPLMRTTMFTVPVPSNGLRYCAHVLSSPDLGDALGAEQPPDFLAGSTGGQSSRSNYASICSTSSAAPTL
ncbi:hypothetical protein [Streptomyces silvisoli]|uniref:Uncharacterized protein n=1 Tax=Streptomyces silvisoli TaxID=3034235 RepID=A0ABT5ZXK2_9ACTN|nr:hypothetical protein [Streptomyces silvisoli]MDF3294381.1 hypothetical protein [Streptomyces silvisoli]